MDRTTKVSEADIMIRIFEGDYKCAGANACTYSTPPRDYPHMTGTQPYWIRNIPHPDSDKKKKWTKRYRDYEGDHNEWAYLPTILVHELGHTLGLAHSANRSIPTIYPGVYAGDTVMSEYSNYRDAGQTCTATNRARCGLADEDIDAIESIYEWR